MASIMVHSYKSVEVSIKDLQTIGTPCLTLRVDGIAGDEVCLFLNQGSDQFLADLDVAIRAYLDNRK